MPRRVENQGVCARLLINGRDLAGQPRTEVKVPRRGWPPDDAETDLDQFQPGSKVAAGIATLLVGLPGPTRAGLSARPRSPRSAVTSQSDSPSGETTPTMSAVTSFILTKTPYQILDRINRKRNRINDRPLE